MSRFPRIIIAGLRGGSGKTTLALGVIASLRRRGLSLAVYKKGPDYIDSGWLSAAAGRHCYNLDPFLVSREQIVCSFADHFGKSDCAVIEGNRGLYDGMDSSGTYSTAGLAKLLRAPVILILDCTKVTRTVASVILGMQKFDRKIDIRGVVLNQVAGARHENVVRKAIKAYCGIPVLGAIPKLNGEFLSERHMGLTPFQEHPDVEKVISYTAEIGKKYLDLDSMVQIARKARPLAYAEQRIIKPRATASSGRQQCHDAKPKIRIGIIRDSAFQFYYPENFEELEKRGAELLEISALKEGELPAVDALYIGGGFPETHAIALAKNIRFRNALKKAVHDGLPVYAECGGLMYLGRDIRLEGKKYPMSAIFPVTFSLEKKPQAHGYTIVESKRRNPFYARGTVLRGHEFHYSKVLHIGKKAGQYFSLKMKRGQGIINKEDGLCYKNAFATYTHLHALGSPQWAEGLIERAKLFSQQRKVVT